MPKSDCQCTTFTWEELTSRAYHNVLQRTVCFWKTLFYHLIDVAVVNSLILYNLLRVEAGKKPISENNFRDKPVLQIIEKYGRKGQEKRPVGKPPHSDCRVHRGSKIYPFTDKARCQYCRMQGQTNWTQRKCPDCPHLPALCQIVERDCHSKWHDPAIDDLQSLWVAEKMDNHPEVSSERTLRRLEKAQVLATCTLQTASESAGPSAQGSSASDPSHNPFVLASLKPVVSFKQDSHRGRGRPRGSINRRRRQGNYRSKS